MDAKDKVYDVGDFVTVDCSIIAYFDYMDKSVPEWLKEGMSGEVIAFRVSSTQINPCIRWIDSGRITNLAYLGLMFGGETEVPLSVMECPVEYLNEEEKVLRGMIEDGYQEAEAISVLNGVKDSMAKYNIIFYIP